MIQDQNLKRKFDKFLNEVDKKLKFFNQVSLLTEPKSKAELKSILRGILRHEVTHIILDKNKINFQKKGDSYWKYDEGLVTYCDFLIDKKLDRLEKLARDTSYKGKMEHWYWVYGLKFKNLLNDKKSPLDRRKAVKKLYHELEIRK